MKISRRLKIIILLFFLIFPGKYCSSQYNPYTNSFESSFVDSPFLLTSTFLTFGDTVNPIQCHSGNFFGISMSGRIDRLLLTGNTVVFDSLIIFSSNNRSLAISNELCGNPFSPTFYCNDGFSTNNAPVSWNGSSWFVNSPGYLNILANCGGSGNYLYFSGITTGITEVVRYTGNSYSVIYQCPSNRRICVADLAVDDSGNVYFLTNSNQNSISDSLIVISPIGQILLQTPLTLDCSHAYGSFIMNGIYYIGFGSSNPIYPNTLLPISILSTSAVIGNAINNPFSNYADLASCQPGISSAIYDYSNRVNFTVGPIPFTDNIVLNFSNTHFYHFKIFNIAGKIVYEQFLDKSTTSIEINLDFLSNGVYFIELQSSTQICRKKILKS